MLSGRSYQIADDIPGWKAANGEFEIWDEDIYSVGAIEGVQLLELNAKSRGRIYQDFETTPGSTIRWSFSHRARRGTDALEMLLGSPSDTSIAESVRIDEQWTRYEGTYHVPAGQWTTRIEFNSLEDSHLGNLLDAISVSLD